MELNIRIHGEYCTYNLYNIIYHNQRFFCLGVSEDGQTIKRFISTKGFDRLLVESQGGAEFNFKLSHFSPYLCRKDKDIWKESDLLDKEQQNFKTSDIGPSEYSGRYVTCYLFNSYRDDVYFEQVKYELNKKFDPYMYQTDDLYFTQHHSASKNSLPTIFNIYNNESIFNTLSITHGVKDDGTEFFDTKSLVDVCNADLGHPNMNGFYAIARSADKHIFLHEEKIGISTFYKKEQILKFESDCGSNYITKNITKKFSRKKQVFRYLYEYYRVIHECTSNRRKVSIPAQTRPKEFLKEDFYPVFPTNEMGIFKIVYFNDIFTVENRHGLVPTIPGFGQFCINGVYDYKSGIPVFDEFETRNELSLFIQKNLGTTSALRLNNIIATWFQPTYGYVPRNVIIKMATKANCQPLSDKLTIYSIPVIENNGEIFCSNTYVNFFQLLANFGLGLPIIRNLLRMNEWSSHLEKELNITLDIYHIVRDTRRPLLPLENNDKQISQCMISLKSAIQLITLFHNTTSLKKNGFWYRNANKLIQAFPDILENNIFSSYSLIGAKGFLNYNE